MRFSISPGKLLCLLLLATFGLWSLAPRVKSAMKYSVEERRIVIIGGGVIGACSAYYLTRHPSYDPTQHSIVVLEATSIAGGSSGKAGGMLATYASPECLAPLSFKLHQDLAKEHNGTTWGYRHVPCGEFAATGQDSEQATRLHTQDDHVPLRLAVEYPSELDWIIPDSVKSYREVGDANHTAQVHPYLFTTTMLDLAKDKGAQVIIGRATSINYKPSGRAVRSVSYRTTAADEEITSPATDIILAAGPWTPTIFPRASIGGARSHNIVVHPSRPVSGFALWPDITPGDDGRPKEFISPEIYSRPDGMVYCCGPTDYDVPLPATSDKVPVNNQSCSDIFDAVGSISKELDHGGVTVRQACYRPIVVIGGERQHTGPLLGET